MRKNEEDQGSRLLAYGKAILLGGTGAFGLCVLLLLLTAIGISQGLLDAALRDQITVVVCVISSLFGGLFAVRQSPSRGLLIGLAVGAVLFLLQLTLGVLIYDTFSLENGGIGLMCGALCGGAAAGILGGGGKRRSGRGKKRRPR